MGFQDAIKVCLSKYVDFGGRARRSEYWYFVLFNIVVSIVAGIIDGALGLQAGMFGVLGLLAGLALLLPGWAVSVRRLHDIGKSGWWLLLVLIPLVGAIILIVFAAQAGNVGPNAYGEDPKAGSAA